MAALIQVSHLHKQYGPRVLFDDAEVTFSENQKFGVIGRNGAGKSTLFNIITGKEQADSGEVWLSPDLRLSYLEQKDTHLPGETVLEFLMRTTEQEDWRCGKVAGKFQIKNNLLETKIDDLAGGFRMRVKLSAMMLHDPNLLLLDEPTNYLDLKTLLLLEDFLRGFNGAAMIISHDREFLMRTTTHTMEVDNQRIATFPGTVDQYLTYKDEVREQIQRQNENIEARKKELQAFVDRFKAKASKASQAQSKMKQIAKLQTTDMDGPARKVRMRLPPPAKKGGIALTCKNLTIGYEKTVIADKIDFTLPRGGHFAILGDNGQGKSTYLKTIGGAIPALGGEVRWGSETKLGYYAQHVYETLEGHENILTYLEKKAPPATTRQEVMNMAGAFLFQGDDTKKEISVLSGGERSRVLLLGLLLSRCDVLLLDEPTNHLDFETVEILAEALRDFGGTVFFVSHDRTFVDAVATGILEVKDGDIRLYNGSYEEYVYNLSQQIAEEQSSDSRKDKKKSRDAEPAQTDETSKITEKSDKNGQRADKKTRDKELKAIQKRHGTLGKEIEQLQTEQRSLLAAVEKNPDQVSRTDYDRLGEIARLLETQEAEWLSLSEQLELDKEMVRK